ncbi:MAG: hypothetical protein IPK72_11825 [Candidatus Eisenbacteria bacterium]|nr:hypothetical protein [Candidatus Eisenbacteria bacterium]
MGNLRRLHRAIVILGTLAWILGIACPSLLALHLIHDHHHSGASGDAPAHRHAEEDDAHAHALADPIPLRRPSHPSPEGAITLAIELHPVPIARLWTSAPEPAIDTTPHRTEPFAARSPVLRI